MELDKNILIEIVRLQMPYGRFKGRLLCDLPVPYLEWMARKEAWPKGRLGELLQNVLVIKVNNLDHLLWEIKKW